MHNKSICAYIIKLSIVNSGINYELMYCINKCFDVIENNYPCSKLKYSDDDDDVSHFFILNKMRHLAFP